ncbi:MAG: YcxB family protein [Paraglaciecola sp.]|nr:YcxB family protein [Paraglaciecola sp.]
MTTPFSYSITYTLDKSHYLETYDASAVAINPKKAYLIAIGLAALGFAILLFTQIEPFAAWFLIALGGLEVFSIRFRRSWWLARQLISKAASTDLTLTIDETGVTSQSIHVESHISWDDISKLEKTSQGWLLYHSGGKTYLSDRCLSAEAQAFIAAKSVLVSE